LGQRLTGGTAVALAASRLERDGNAVLLRMNASHADLVGDAVQRRLKVLGNVLGLEPKLIVV
jgi:exopolyphosphatase/guanosine-5'-triphosphate,3'-diphosphate pyrophosphatase